MKNKREWDNWDKTRIVNGELRSTDQDATVAYFIRF
jgi:hypothetical protein